MSIRVVVLDDFGVVRDGLRLLLDAEPDIETIGEAENLQEGVACVRELDPDVVLLDLLMHERVSVDAIPALLRAAPGTAVVVVSPLDDPCHVRDSFAAGAAGYVLKQAPAAKLLEAVREAALGGSYLDPAVGARLALAEATGAPTEGGELLCEREREILRLLALGYTCAEIAPMVKRSPRTVELYRARIMEKLNAQTRAELVRYALAQGLLKGGEGEGDAPEAVPSPGASA